MTAARFGIALEPVDLGQEMRGVGLYLGQVCQIAGISKMQLDYWTNKAQIPTKGNKQRIYDADAVETVMLIKQAKDKGLNLGAAIASAHAYKSREAAKSGD
jgi:DNA-binding transcriptional MerR regulator